MSPFPSPFRLITMGSLRVEGSDWHPAKALTLLAYLSLQGPTARRRLRELFWPDAQDAGASLRVLLGQFRKRLPEVIRGEETLEAVLDSDAATLLGMNEDGGSAPDAEVYAGAFLAGVELSEVSAELEEWVLELRERLAVAARLAAIRAAELAGSPAESGQWAERAVAIAEAPPMEQVEIERLLRLALPGSRLEAELRREQAEVRGPQAATILPGPEQALLGREHELDALLLSLSDPAVRLIEITGSGGIGKSTLAAALLREQADLSGVRVLSIPLETAQASSEAAARMVVALNLEVNDRGDGWLALARAWGERPLLALLDGAEGLSDLGRGLETLMTHCPNVRVIVTSRLQRLTLPPSGFQPHPDRMHLALDGLSVPSAGESPERVARSAAVQLFVRGARRYLPHFFLDPQSAPLVSAIVRRLDGHPLATVLSATWIRVHPPALIHTLILQDLTALRAESGTSERHHLTAVFERSWHLLTPDEAEAISALAVFQGFTPEAAREVAGVTPAVIESLNTHSLLRRRPLDLDGQWRLEVPPVLAAQALAHLTDAAAVQDAHAAYYLNRLMTHPPESDEVDVERANIVAAVAYGLGRGRDMAEQIDTLLSSYDRRGLLDSGTDAFYMLREALPDENSEAEGSILVGLAWLAQLSSRHDDAEALCQLILSNRRFEVSKIQMKALNIFALSLRKRGNVRESLPFLEQAIAVSEELQDSERSLMYRLNVVETQIDVGDYSAARTLSERLKRLPVAEKNTALTMYLEASQIRLSYYSSLDDPVKIVPLVKKFIEKFATSPGHRTYIMVRIIELRISMLSATAPELRKSAEEIEAQIKSSQYVDLEIALHLIRAEMNYLIGHSEQARRELRLGYEAALKIQDVGGLYELLLTCYKDLASRDRDAAISGVNFVLSEKRSTASQRHRAQNALRALSAEAEDRRSVQAWTLEEACRTLSDLLGCSPTRAFHSLL